MVEALQRAEQLPALGTGRVEAGDIPANRLQVLARTGLGSKATAPARLGEPKRTATLVAMMRHMEAAAVDDTLDLFALLMSTRLFSPARRASAEHRLAMLPRLEKVPKTVARAGRALLDLLAAADESGAQLDVAALWMADREGGASGRSGRRDRPGRRARAGRQRLGGFGDAHSASRPIQHSAPVPDPAGRVHRPTRGPRR